MKFLLETPTAPYALRTLITWSFLILFNVIYVFLTKPPITLSGLLSGLLGLLFVSLATSMQIPNPSETTKETTQFVTYSFIFGLLTYGSANLILRGILPKWPVIFLTTFGAISVTLSSLLGYICSSEAKLFSQ